nr:prephenate dehydrogenase/arogenate dehydrogenase family protein [Candidatus Sigynarchaeota archaeon]
MATTTITIAGITGQMGTWFARYFSTKGWTVFGYSRSEARARDLEKTFSGDRGLKSVKVTTRLDECIPASDWVLLSIPIPAHGEMIECIAPLMKEGGVMVDIASVKGEIPGKLIEARKKHGFHVLSTHPMFGPGAESMEKKNFVLIDLEGDKMILDTFKNIIIKDQPNIIESTVDEHDKMIALTLGLPHMLNILFGKVLKDMNVDVKRLTEFGGTSFHLQHLISQEVVSQEPFIYATIEMENKEFMATLPLVKRMMDELLVTLKGKDYDAFIAEFLAIRQKYASCDEFKSVMKRFNAAARASLELLK